ncbi:MAG: pitrilysin family protein [Pseudomonadota bacterium]
MQHERIKLKNNLEVLYINFPGSMAGSVQMWFRAGSALEGPSDEGIAHFLEHMFFKGTPTRPGAMLAHEVESYGAELNAFTSFDYTCYYINTPNSYLPKSVEILLDMMAHPQFKESDLIPERDVVFEEYRRSLDSPNQFSFHQLQQSAFTSKYAHPILGNEKTIKKFSSTQLRAFRKNFYNLSNSLLIVAGDLKARERITKIIETFPLPAGKDSKFPKFRLKNFPTVEIHHKDVRMAQLTVALGAPAYTGLPTAAEDLAINCLGHGETSRIYQKLVLESSLSNTCSSSTMYMADGGIHFIRIVFPHQHLRQILQKLSGVLKEIMHEGIEKEEIEKIKNQYLSTKIYDMESLESYAFSLGHGFAQTGNPNCEEEFIERIKKASIYTVNQSYKDIFRRQMHMGLQIPKGESLENASGELCRFRENVTTFAKREAKKKSLITKLQTTRHDTQLKIVPLKNGITLLYRQNPISPTFVMHTYLKGGLCEESNKSNGSYSLLSSLLTKGHDGISYNQIKNIIEDRSAHLGGFSGKNAYGLTMHAQTQHINDLFPLFVGALVSPDFPIKYLAHDKKMVLRQLESQKEDPIKICFNSMAKTIFTNHPYAMNILGDEHSVRKIERSDLNRIHNKNLREKEILFTYCGDMELSEILDLLIPAVAKLSPRRKTKTLFKKYLPQYGQNNTIPLEREQTHILIAFPIGPMALEENLYLKVLTTHLAGQSSDLFVEVRDRLGLCYSVQPVHYSALEGGYWGIYMASGHDKVNLAISAIHQILNHIAENGLSASEFNRVKKMIKGQNLIDVQTNEDYANIYSVPYLHGMGVDYYYKNNRQVDDMSHPDFQHKIKKILSRKSNTVIVGKS